VTAWACHHPRVRRCAVVAAAAWVPAVAATCLAPRASASTNAAVLDWTGLADSYGVPLGDYYLALPSVRDQLTQAGPAPGWDPASWATWTVHALAVMADRITAAAVLTAEAGLFVGLVALALWLMKLTVSTYWLTVIGEIARAISTAVVEVTTRMGLLLLAIPLGVFAGVVTVRRGEAGRGATMILVALTLPALSVTVFADPAGQMYGPHGLLTFGRSVGFSVAQATTHDGTVGADGVATLTSSLITHVVREPLQLWNFGHVVDHVGGCGAAWSAAMRSVTSNAPIDAMRACGDQAAVAHAVALDGTNVWVGAVLVCAGALLAVFMVASGWAVLKVSVKAIWTTVILLPALWLGAIPGAPQRKAATVAWQFFQHGIEVCVYVGYVSVIGLAVERMVSAPLPAEVGGTNPFAHVLMMGGVSIAAFLLLRHIRAELSGSPSGRGTLGRAGEVALGMGLQAAVGGAGSAASKGMRGLLGAGRGAGERAPWEDAPGAPDEAHRVHGAPHPGFDPVPGGAAPHADARATLGPPAGGLDRDMANAAAPSAGTPVGPAGDGAAGTARAAGAARRPSLSAGATGSPEGSSTPPDGEGAATGPGAPSIPPIIQPDHRTELPLPPEPPEQEPPPEHPGPPGEQPTTVDPINPA
jgi:hypothetical protein